jgi:multidrug efflux pump subunit AcrA (membrane-fusion protein)
MNCLLINILLLMASLFLLSACGGSPAAMRNDESLLSQAIAEGYILPFNPNMLELQSEVATITRATLTDTQIRMANPVYITHRHLYFETANRTLSAIHVERGQRVRAGDILAELEPLDREEAERLFLRQRNAQIELERFNRNFVAERDRWLNDLAQAQVTLDLAGDDEWPRLALNLARQEVSYQQFLMNNEQNRERLLRNLDNINEQLAGDQIIAPIDGVVIWVATIAPGTFVQPQQGRSPRIVTLVKEDSLFLAFSLPSSDMLLGPNELLAMVRYGDVFPMTMMIMPDVRFTFDVRVVNDPWATGARNNIQYLLAPLDWDALYDVFDQNEVNLAMPLPPNFMIEITTQAVDVLVVPAAAVREGYVYLYEDGYRRRQNVVLGFRCGETNGRYREVLSGLYEGQRVILW